MRSVNKKVFCLSLMEHAVNIYFNLVDISYFIEFPISLTDWCFGQQNMIYLLFSTRGVTSDRVHRAQRSGGHREQITFQ